MLYNFIAKINLFYVSKNIVRIFYKYKTKYMGDLSKLKTIQNIIYEF